MEQLNINVFNQLIFLLLSLFLVFCFFIYTKNWRRRQTHHFLLLIASLFSGTLLLFLIDQPEDVLPNKSLFNVKSIFPDHLQKFIFSKRIQKVPAFLIKLSQMIHLNHLQTDSSYRIHLFVSQQFYKFQTLPTNVVQTFFRKVFVSSC